MSTRPLWLVLAGLSLVVSNPRRGTPEGSPPRPRPSPAPRPMEAPATNLKVLPRDWTRRQVIDQVMKRWTAELGVRCQHCHVGQEGAPWADWDFASDAKPTKRRAREMQQMLEEINRRLSGMRSLEGSSGAPLQASCFTCHHGVPRPRRIEEILASTRAARGLDAAIAEYRDLRAKYLAAGVYDFRAMPLVREAKSLLAAREAAGAQKLLDLALELGLDSLATRSALADAALAVGDRAAAVAHLQKALAFAQNASEKEFVEEQLRGARAGSPTP